MVNVFHAASHVLWLVSYRRRKFLAELNEINKVLDEMRD
jgi:hypothetical protein